MNDYEDQLRALNQQLLNNIKKNLPELEKLLEEISGHWVAEDFVYRYYHQSFKVFYIQEYNIKITNLLKSLAPEGCTINSMFEEIYKEGTGKIFKHEDNRAWSKTCRPMVEDMSTYGRMLSPLQGLPGNGL